MKKYRIVMTIYSYSKKRGMYSKDVTILKRSTWEQVEKFIKEEYGKSITPDTQSFQIPGWLNPITITIKEYKR